MAQRQGPRTLPRKATQLGLLAPSRSRVPQKGPAAGPDDGQAETPHLLRLVPGEADVADSGVVFLIGTTGAALLAVINRPFPHISSLLASHAIGLAGSKSRQGKSVHNDVSA
jgi:hypothetical protein